MSNLIFSDYSKLDFQTPEGRKKVFGAVQYFANKRIEESRKLRKAIQAFGTSGDFPTAPNQIIEKFHALPAYDTAYEEIFDVKDFTGTREAGFDILDVEDGLAFKKIPTGQAVEIYKMGGSKVSVGFDMYGGGLGWSRVLIDDQKYWTIEDNAVAFVNKAAEDRAANHMALIEAIAATYNVDWQLPEPAALANTNELYTANRDAQTLNKAAIDILTDLKDKGYGVTPNTVFKVLTPIQLVGRLNRALSLMLQSVGGSATFAAFKFQIVPTITLTTTTVYYVCVPKLKAKSGNRMNLTIFDKFDETKYEDIAVGWMRYGAAIGDQEQFRRCAIS